uniref:DDE Tnp4 domain-containing protein n=1 Tax=Sphenodon punctatus TaxID=8508 RepID=A0A8D0HT84_SPHPU
MREPIPMVQRVAIGVWALATPDSCRSVSQHFGVGLSTVACIVRDVCEAVEGVLLDRTIQLLDQGAVMAGFAAGGFPNCIGAVDGTHIEILRPAAGEALEYVNRHGYYSLHLQGVVDHRARFIDIYTGNSGRSHDARIMTISPFYARMYRGDFADMGMRWIEGVPMPPCILGDPAYPLTRWLMKVYPVPNTPAEQVYNTRLCASRTVVERAFGALKQRWRSLAGRLDFTVPTSALVIGACCVLHNVCETEGAALEAPEPHRPPGPVPLYVNAGNPREYRYAKRIRNALATHIARGGPL